MRKGKGDLVGCDISMHLLASSNGQGGTTQQHSSGGQDVLVKSSSDVKVSTRRRRVSNDMKLERRDELSTKR